MDGMAHVHYLCLCVRARLQGGGVGVANKTSGSIFSVSILATLSSTLIMLSHETRRSIISMHKNGLTPKQILGMLRCQDVECCKATVHNIISLWKKVGDVRPRYPRRKRKPKCQPHIVNDIDVSTKTDRFLKAADLVKRIKRKYGNSHVHCTVT